MHAKQPLVTVYIPTHNRVTALQRAVASVQAQTYPAIELIVVDDGSTDGTLQYLAAAQASGILRAFYNRTSQGACVARNRAIEVAQGSLITGLDDDDEFTAQRIERLVAAFTQANHNGQKVSCVASGLIEVASNGGERLRRGRVGQVTLTHLLHKNVLGNQVLTRTEWLRSIGGFDPTMPALQDYDTWVRLVEQYGPGLKLGDCLYRWHTGSGQQISTNQAARLRGLERFIDKYAGLMNNAQRNSMQVLQAKLSGARLTFRQALHLANRYNLRALLALMLAQRAQPLLTLYRGLRARRLKQ